MILPESSRNHATADVEKEIQAGVQKKMQINYIPKFRGKKHEMQGESLPVHLALRESNGFR